MFGLGRAVGAAGGRTSDKGELLKRTRDDEQAAFCGRSNPYSADTGPSGPGRPMKTTLLTGAICYTGVLHSMRPLCV